MSVVFQEESAAASVFRFIPDHQRERFEALLREERHDYLAISSCAEGDPADAFFVMVSGRARVVKTGNNGEEMALGMLRAGDEFGESALLTGGVRSASVRCSSAVVVRRLDRESFEALATESPGVPRLPGTRRALAGAARIPLRVQQLRPAAARGVAAADRKA